MLFTSSFYYSLLLKRSSAVFIILYHWRGHKTSLTVVSLRGRLPQKLQSKSTFSCEIVQMRSPFRHGFIKKPKSEFN